MDHVTCARVAAVVGSAAAQKRVSAVFDYSAQKQPNVSADVRTGDLSGYDYSTSSLFSGAVSSRNNSRFNNSDFSGSFEIYDYQKSARISLTLEINTFAGFDYSTQSHFCGSVNGSAISIYDYSTGQYHDFSV